MKISSPVSPRAPRSFARSLVMLQKLRHPTTVALNVTPVNDPPVADAGPSQSALRHALVVLDGSGSSDVDGKALTYTWTIVSMPLRSKAQLTGATTAHPTFRADKQGIYVVQLIVNDGTADSAPSEVTISAAK